MASPLKAGCAGFPIGRARYFAALPTVELSDTFERVPKLSTLAAIKADAPPGFEFSMRASQLVTHCETSAGFKASGLKLLSQKRRLAVGHFRDTPEVGLAWENTRNAAEVLGAKFVVFETPTSFYPDADHLRDMYRFFRNVRRPRAALLIWQPKGSGWLPKMVRKVCLDLDLVHSRDPLDASGEDAPSPLRGRPALQYLRLRGGMTGSYADGELKEIRKSCVDVPSYVYFTNRLNSFRDARRFLALTLGESPKGFAFRR